MDKKSKLFVGLNFLFALYVAIISLVSYYVQFIGANKRGTSVSWAFDANSLKVPRYNLSSYVLGFLIFVFLLFVGYKFILNKQMKNLNKIHGTAWLWYWIIGIILVITEVVEYVLFTGSITSIVSLLLAKNLLLLLACFGRSIIVFVFLIVAFNKNTSS